MGCRKSRLREWVGNKRPEWVAVAGIGSHHRVLRGGAFNNNTRNVRAAVRNNRNPNNRNRNNGFRLVVVSTIFQSAGIAWRGVDAISQSRFLPGRGVKNGGAGSRPRPEHGRFARSHRTGHIATAPRPGHSPWRGATGGTCVRPTLHLGQSLPGLPQRFARQAGSAGRRLVRVSAGRQPDLASGRAAVQGLPPWPVLLLLHPRAQAPPYLRRPLPRSGRPPRPMQTDRAAASSSSAATATPSPSTFASSSPVLITPSCGRS